MSDYKEIKGKTIQYIGTDPSDTGAEGQVWYNSAAGAFKSVVALEAWSSGAPLINEHQDTSAAGTQTAGLCFGGTPPSGGITNTEEYNGSGWATGGALNTGRRGAARFSASTQTAGLVFGGSGSPNPTVLNATEEYDGTSWTSGNNLPAVKYIHGGAGIQTAALSFGGYSGTATLATTEVYDGTNWTAGNAMSTARYSLASAGLQTAALAFGGTPPETAETEEYDGTNWTTGGNMITARRYAAGCGTQDSALVFGAGPLAVVKTEMYDGTSWTETADMGIAQKNHGGAGSQSAALSCGGESPTNSRFVTQEFNKSANVITAAAWASGGNLNTGRATLSGAGSQTAALAFGGTVFTPATPSNPFKNESEEYNGTSWTEGNNLNQARSSIVGAGTQTAAIGAGGLPGSGASNTANSEEYDGTSWTEGNNLVNASYSRAGAGTQTATILMGGGNYTNPPSSFSYISNVEYYDGTSWSEQNDMNTARYVVAGCGSQTSSLVSGGLASPGTVTNVEEWNGTSWSEVNDLIVANYGHALTGIQTAALQAAGNDGSVTAAAFNYDGTSWTTAPSIATARQSLAGGGEGSTQTSSIVFGGTITPAPTGYQQTEEFTGESSALNLKTLTTS